VGVKRVHVEEHDERLEFHPLENRGRGGYQGMGRLDPLTAPGDDAEEIGLQLLAALKIAIAKEKGKN
jgi:hypothetical protein